MWHRAFCILFFCCLWAPATAAAQGADTAKPRAETDVFTVQGLAVDVTAESAVAARAQALRSGQRQALNRVMRRLTLNGEHANLPRPDNKAVAQMVAAVQVENEKTSNVRYLANLTVRFQRAAVRNLLRGAGIGFSETRAKTSLVLPVYEKGAALSLFEDGNLWREAWERVDLPVDSLLPLVLPAGDLRDITTITAEAALSGREDQLRAIGQHYGVDNVVVLHAVLSFDLAAGGAPKIQVNLLRFTSRGRSTEVLDYGASVGEDIEADMNRLAGRIAADQLEQWKRRTQLTFGSETSLSAQVPLQGLADWLTVRQRLADTAMVRAVSLRGISRLDAQVVIDYLGDTDSLVVSLAQRDLHLTLVDGFWVLRLAAEDGAGAQ